jgi:hypothetical protein
MPLRFLVLAGLHTRIQVEDLNEDLLTLDPTRDVG